MILGSFFLTDDLEEIDDVEELEKLEFESEFKSSFETSNLFDNDLFDDDLSDDKSDKSIRNQEIFYKIILKLTFLISEKKCKNINKN